MDALENYGDFLMSLNKDWVADGSCSDKEFNECLGAIITVLVTPISPQEQAAWEEAAQRAIAAWSEFIGKMQSFILTTHQENKVYDRLKGEVMEAFDAFWDAVLKYWSVRTGQKDASMFEEYFRDLKSASNVVLGTFLSAVEACLLNPAKLVDTIRAHEVSIRNVLYEMKRILDRVQTDPSDRAVKIIVNRAVDRKANPSGLLTVAFIVTSEGDEEDSESVVTLKSKSKRGWKFWLVVSIAIVGILALLACLCRCCCRRNDDVQEFKELAIVLDHNNALRISQQTVAV
jgi:hypothetical protein